MESILQKRCTGCKEIKPVSEFSTRNSAPDKLSIYCRECDKLSKQRRALLLNPDYKPRISLVDIRPGYKHCRKCKVEKELSEFCKDKTGRDGHSDYCFRCVRKHEKVEIVQARDGHRFCRNCGLEKELSEFPDRLDRPNGMYKKSPWCYRCQRELKKQKRSGSTLPRDYYEPIDIGNKRCSRCQCVKSILDFCSNRTSKDGRNTYCKKCTSEIHKLLNARKPKGAGIIGSKFIQRGENVWATNLCCSTRTRSRLRKIEFNLTSEFIKNLFDKQGGICHYFGVAMVKNSDIYRDPFKASIDRVDIKMGYTEDNVVLCCAGANLAKNACSLEHFIGFVRSIKDAIVLLE